MSKLSIIIVSYNSLDLLKNCLNSIFSQDYQDIEVIIVDNASEPSPAKLLTKKFPSVKLIQNKKNLGFAKANNIGIKKSKSDYTLLLNSDTLVVKNALPSMIEFMDNHPRVAIASPQLTNLDGSTQSNGGSLPRLSNIAAWMLFIDDLPIIKNIFPSYHRNSSYYQKTRSTGWVSGAAMVLRPQALDEIGPLDENIFMYGEDTDLCLRAHQKNWQVSTVSEAKVTHLAHGSGAKSLALVKEFQGLKYLFSKHKPKWEAPILTLLLKLGALLRLTIFGTILRDKTRYEIYKQAFKVAG